MNHKRREIQNLILMLASAVFIAVVLVALLLYAYGSSRLDQVLISPRMLKKSALEFIKVPISINSYAAFYKKTKNLRSLSSQTEKIAELFSRKVPSTLTIYVPPEDNRGAFFQEVQFLDHENIFRARVKKGSSQGEWVYFRFPNIDSMILKLFVDYEQEG